MRYLRFAPSAVFLFLGLGGIIAAVDDFDMGTFADSEVSFGNFALPIGLLVIGALLGLSAKRKFSRTQSSGNMSQGWKAPFVQGASRNGYSTLGLPPWNSIRVTNFGISKDQFFWGTSAAQRVIEHFGSNAVRVSGETAVYMPEVGAAFSSATQESIDPVDTQHFFNLGWMVAEVEDMDGIARPGLEADAVRIAFNVLGQVEPISIFRAKAIESGYFAMRTRVSPSDLRGFILTGSR